MIICKGETKLRSAAANREPGMHVYTKLRMFKILDTILLYSWSIIKLAKL